MSTRTVTPAVAAPVAVFTPQQRPMLQRTCDCGQHTGGGQCEDCKKKKKMPLQRQANGSAAPAIAPPIVHEVLRSPGQPLDDQSRAFFEPRFGCDFSRIQVHTGEQAAASASAVNAAAYTVGHNLVFGRNQYAPRTSSGKQLLAHELTHVVQQAPASSEAIQLSLNVGPSDSPLEREASASANRIANGQSAVATAGGSSSILSRQTTSPTPATQNPTHGTASTAEEPITLPLTHSTGNYGLGVYQSEVRNFSGIMSPCLLTLSLRLHFDFQDAPKPAPVTRKLWSAAEQNSWTNAFIRTVTSRWSYRYPLVPADPKKCALWTAGVCDRALARVEVIPVLTDAHADVVVYHNVASDWRSSAGYGGAHMAQKDVQPRDTGNGVQVTAEHEFGHLLGLDHSNPACKSTAKGPAKDSGQPGCYVGTPEQTADVMGSGSTVTPQDYAPFLEEMNYYSKCDWKAEGSAPKGSGSSFLSGHAGLATGALLGAAGGAVLGGVFGGAVGAVLGGLAGAAGGALIGLIADTIAS